jgi:hypothetical protein
MVVLYMVQMRDIVLVEMAPVTRTTTITSKQLVGWWCQATPGPRGMPNGDIGVDSQGGPRRKNPSYPFSHTRAILVERRAQNTCFTTVIIDKLAGHQRYVMPQSDLELSFAEILIE